MKLARVLASTSYSRPQGHLRYERMRSGTDLAWKRSALPAEVKHCHPAASTIFFRVAAVSASGFQACNE